MTTNKLKQVYRAFQQANPGVRIRDAAVALNVSEAELLATSLGEGVTRLRADWATFLPGLDGVGPLMALTRNDAAVIEKTGDYANVRLQGPLARIKSEYIDLTILLSEWVNAFAVEDDLPEGIRHSVHVFNAGGTAVHKLYARKATDNERFLALIRSVRSDDQTPPVLLPGRMVASQPAAGEQSPAEAEASAILARFRGKPENAGRQPGGRIAGSDSVRRMLEMCVSEGVSMQLTVASPGAIQVHAGPVFRLKATPPWFNILDPDFNLHLREDLVALARVTETNEEGDEALEAFDASGRLIAIFKAGHPEDPDGLTAWRGMLRRLL
jgi:putative hemin transport protein